MKYRILSSNEFYALTSSIIGNRQSSGENLSYRLPSEKVIRQRLCSITMSEPGFLTFCAEMEKFREYLTTPFGLVQLLFEALEATQNKLRRLPVEIVSVLPMYILALVPDDEAFAVDTVDWLETFRADS